MEEFRMDASVFCTDGRVGKVQALIVDPVAEEMTHLVVREPGRHDIERLVSIDVVESATHDEVHLTSTKQAFQEFELFHHKRYIEEQLPDNLSMQIGRSLPYDPKTGVVVGDEEATKLLARPYRKPWVHPDPATV